MRKVRFHPRILTKPTARFDDVQGVLAGVFESPQPGPAATPLRKVDGAGGREALRPRPHLVERPAPEAEEPARPARCVAGVPVSELPMPGPGPEPGPGPGPKPEPEPATAAAAARPPAHLAADAALPLPPQQAQLAQLRQAIAGLEATYAAPHAAPALPLGDLDAHLPHDGLPAGVLNEVTASYADRPAAYGFTFALLAIAQQTRKGPAVLVMSRQALRDFGHPYGHGLRQFGLDVGQLILVEAGKDADALWAIEEALKTRGSVAMVAGAITGSVGLTSARRLNLAAASAATPLALLRTGAEDAGPAATRWRVAAAPAARAPYGGFAHWRWNLTLERCRNGRPGRWLIEWSHAAHRFHMVESLAHRTSAAEPERRNAG